jgi:hypothetical protein
MSKYTDFVKTLPCCHTGQYGVDAHHMIGVDKMGKTGGKNHDITAMPLIREVHTAVHNDPKGWPQTRWMVETQIKAIEAGVITI